MGIAEGTVYEILGRIYIYTSIMSYLRILRKGIIPTSALSTYSSILIVE